MAFDLDSAKPVEAGGFDLASAKTVGPSTGQRILSTIGQGVQRAGGGPVALASELFDKAAYGLGGKVTDVTGSPAAGYVANVATQAVPAVFGGQIAKSAAPLMESGAKKLMGSALKPTVKMWETKKAERAIDTLLDEGINATKGGVEKLRGLIDELNTEVKATIANSTARIDATGAQRAIDDTLNKFKYQATPAADEKAIRAVWQEFKDTWLASGSMPVQEAQLVKQGTQRTVAKAYGKLSDAETEAQKGIARGLREDIAANVPAVVAPLKRESDLINALNVTERRALMDINKNPMGLAALMTHEPMSFIAFMGDKSAAFKSIVARMLNAGQERIPQAAGTGLGALVGAQSGTAPTEQSGLARLLPR